MFVVDAFILRGQLKAWAYFWRAIHIITLCLSHAVVHPGERILEDLHAKGEGLTIVYPKVIKEYTF